MKHRQHIIGPVFDKFIKHGSQMFIAMRLAPSEEEHAVAYYGFMSPKPGAVVVDLGCGIGGLGHYLKMIDKDINVINVVDDPALIEEMECRERYCIKASFDNTGLLSEIADNVMFNESIGHGNLKSVFKEAYRLLKDCGTLTIKDFSTIDGIKEIDFSNWGYKIRRPDVLISEAYKQGFTLVTVQHPFGFRDHWDEIAKDDEDVKNTLGADSRSFPIRQVMYKFVKVPANG